MAGDLYKSKKRSPPDMSELDDEYTSGQSPHELAEMKKELGNKAVKNKDYCKAIQLYRVQ